MNAIELHELITHRDYFYENLIFILIIDKIYTVNDECLKTFIKNKIIEYNFILTPTTSIVQCYYIIKYATLQECINIMIQQNQKFDTHIELTTNTAPYIQYKKLYNDMLEFHLRPRGGHTKGAVAF
jgi:hypothetical protein